MSLDFIDGDSALPKKDAEAIERSESHHRIANSLALISGLVRLQAQRLRRSGVVLPAAEAAAVLDDAVYRLDAVARLHRALSDENKHRMTLGVYLRDVIEALQASTAMHHRVRFTDGARSLSVPSRVLNAVGLFATEAVTNSIKYAHPSGVGGAVDIALRYVGAHIELKIADDGVGFPEGFTPEAHGGLGFRIMRALAEQLDGAISFKSSPLGLQVRLAFAAPAASPP